jgi:hypothetical protein
LSTPYGENNGAAKLTADQVFMIRFLARAEGLGNAELGRRFGVPRETIRDIVNEKTWRHLLRTVRPQGADTAA